LQRQRGNDSRDIAHMWRAGEKPDECIGRVLRATREHRHEDAIHPAQCPAFRRLRALRRNGLPSAELREMQSPSPVASRRR